MLPTVTLGIPACKEHIIVTVLSMQGGGLCDLAREFQQNVDSYEDDDTDEL